MRWVCGFADDGALARVAEAQGGGDSQQSGRSWEFAVLRGARLLDEIVPAMGGPAGVAINVAGPEGAMLFPPVVGIVADSVAVDAGEPDGGRD
ncbi:SseB family protein [Streptomyces niveus]|uniref:SseB family protein n=1 Tax=Streptomyces niveus TaxID=193462 RepID=UPI0035DBB9A5